MDPGSIYPCAVSTVGGLDISIYETVCLAFFSLTAAWSSLLSGVFSVYSKSELDELVDRTNGERDTIRERIDHDLNDIKILQFSSSATSTLSLFLTAIFTYRRIYAWVSPDKSSQLALFGWLALALPVALLIRSEERRVGKECRSRWSPYH